MPRLSKNSVSVRGPPPSYQRDQVDSEAAPASSGMRMRQRGRQSETRGLTLSAVLSTGETRSQARSAANSRTCLRSISSVQRNKGDFRFSMARSVHLGTSRAKSRHGPSARAVIRITVLKKKFVALSGMVSLHANPVNPPHHYISRPALGQRTEDRYILAARSVVATLFAPVTGLRALKGMLPLTACRRGGGRLASRRTRR